MQYLIPAASLKNPTPLSPPASTAASTSGAEPSSSVFTRVGDIVGGGGGTVKRVKRTNQNPSPAPMKRTGLFSCGSFRSRSHTRSGDSDSDKEETKIKSQSPEKRVLKSEGDHRLYEPCAAKLLAEINELFHCYPLCSIMRPFRWFLSEINSVGVKVTPR